MQCWTDGSQTLANIYSTLVLKCTVNLIGLFPSATRSYSTDWTGRYRLVTSGNQLSITRLVSGILAVVVVAQQIASQSRSHGFELTPAVSRTHVLSG